MSVIYIIEFSINSNIRVITFFSPLEGVICIIIAIATSCETTEHLYTSVRPSSPVSLLQLTYKFMFKSHHRHQWHLKYPAHAYVDHHNHYFPLRTLTSAWAYHSTVVAAP